jgi:hypothetical protein
MAVDYMHSQPKKMVLLESGNVVGVLREARSCVVDP